MKVWKTEHAEKSREGVKIALSLSSDKSIGVILKPGEFILSQDQNTASLDSQKRRGFVNVEEFDNFEYRFELGVVYNKEILNTLNKEALDKELQIIIPSDIGDISELGIVDDGTEPENVSIEEIEPLEAIDKLSEARKDTDDYINT